MPPKIIVVISADAEWRVVREYFPQVSVSHTPYGECFEIDTTQLSKPPIAQLPSYPIAFFHQGWGKIAAAGATQHVIDCWRPDLLINLGTCGGFAGEVERFAVILAEQTLVYDIIEQMGDPDEHIAHYATEVDLSWLADPYPQNVIRTLLISADRDLLSEEIPQLEAKYGAIAGDWESGAIAWVAARNGIRCLILRGVTDLVGAEGGEAYAGNLDVFVEGTRKVMHNLLENLAGWLALAGKKL